MNLQSEVDQGLIGAPSDNDNPWEAEPLVEIAEESETVVLYPSDSEGFSLVKVAMIGVTASSDVTLAAGMVGHLNFIYLRISVLSWLTYFLF